jgi:hypothetical protein
MAAIVVNAEAAVVNAEAETAFFGRGRGWGKVFWEDVEGKLEVEGCRSRECRTAGGWTSQPVSSRIG